MITNIACVVLLIFNGLFAFGLGAYSHVVTEMAMEAKLYSSLPAIALSEVLIYENQF